MNMSPLPFFKNTPNGIFGDTDADRAVVRLWKAFKKWQGFHVRNGGPKGSIDLIAATGILNTCIYYSMPILLLTLVLSVFFKYLNSYTNGG